jgi:hypothetical protein
MVGRVSPYDLKSIRHRGNSTNAQDTHDSYASFRPTASIAMTKSGGARGAKVQHIELL